MKFLKILIPILLTWIGGVQFGAFSEKKNIMMMCLSFGCLLMAGLMFYNLLKNRE